MAQESNRSQIALSRLSKPGQAALRFGELLFEDNWAVLGIGLNDFQPLVESYSETWRDQVLGLVAAALLSEHDDHGEPGDMLVRLTTQTFLIITQPSHISLWEQGLRRKFNASIPMTFPADHLCNDMVCLSADQCLPLPSLSIGVVTAQDGPFSNPRDLLSAVTKARDQNGRSALLFRLKALLATANELQEEREILDHAPTLLSLIKCFARVTTGLIHDLRNGLNILFENTRRLSKMLPGVAQVDKLVVSTRYALILLETCSEIRLRGIGASHRIDLSQLLAENESLWAHKIGSAISVEAPPKPVDVYANRFQVTQAVTCLLGWLIGREQVQGRIVLSCRYSKHRGEILVNGDFDLAMDETELIRRSLAELQDRYPTLYVFRKIISRYDGRVQLQSGQITLDFPQYKWQDVQSAETLIECIQTAQIEITTLKTNLKESPAQIPPANDFPLAEIIGLGDQVIADLINELEWIYQEAEKQREGTSGSHLAIWESLAAGSRFCQILATNLLALEGQSTLVPQATNVVQVLESVGAMLRSRMQDLAELEWLVPPILPPVRATDTALAQVMLNLALNSLEELARTRPPISRVGFAAFQVEDAIQIDVSDTGGGIPPEILDRLFKETVSTRQHVEGGVGLQVVKAILDELGGEIRFRSTSGEGTVASITLPIWNDGP